jgi:regulator of protease activity HflC (stomatin/prohibitin superfamily)
LQERATAYGLGLVITGIAFQDVHPPLSVVEVYRDVSRAESDRQRRTNEGNTYRAETLAQAQGQATATVHRAEADRKGRVTRASGESDAFLAQLSARAPFPGLTDHRLYWETIASALEKKPKVVLDPDPARHRHLIVPSLPMETAVPVLDVATKAHAPEGRTP